jgi:hypothetical protein
MMRPIVMFSLPGFVDDEYATARQGRPPFGANYVAAPTGQEHGPRMGAPFSRKSRLGDPQVAAFAWARYRRLLRWMMLVTLTMVVGAVVMTYRQVGLVSSHTYIVTALGISFAMLLTSAVMGLVFLAKGARREVASGDGSRRDQKVTRPPDEA